MCAAGGRRPADCRRARADPNTTCGSIIECENQALGEETELVGTGLRLSYRSTRQLGRKAERTVTIRPPTTAPSTARGFVYEVYVAGQRLTQRLPISDGGPITFVWDGRDAYGRPYQGSAPLIVRTGYLYRPVYASVAVESGGYSFANGSHGASLGILARYCDGWCSSSGSAFFGGELVAWRT